MLRQRQKMRYGMDNIHSVFNVPVCLNVSIKKIHLSFISELPFLNLTTVYILCMFARWLWGNKR